MESNFNSIKQPYIDGDELKEKDSKVLAIFDCFGTTGDAVDSLNKEDKGNRSFILISNSENNICKNVTVERLNKRHIDFHFQ